MQAGLGFKAFSAAKALSAVTQLAVVAALGVVVSAQSSSSMVETAPGVERPAPAEVVAAPSGGVPRDPPASESVTSVDQEEAPALETTEEPVRNDTAERPRSPQRVPSGSSAGTAPGLRDEIKLLDRVRGALRNGEARRALSELDRYAQKFPRGDFRQEASVLRIEALQQSGQHGRATALARDFVTQHPKSPHVERVQRVGGSAGVNQR
jgi:hypothetical protein